MKIPLQIVVLGLAISVGYGFAQTATEPTGERIAARGVDNSVPASSSGAKATSLKRALANPIKAASGSSFISLIGSASTASPAESFALNGNLAYVCDDNEVTIMDVTNPANVQVAGTALSTLIKNTGNIYCAVNGGSLLVFSDQVNTTVGNTQPGFSAFSLANPQNPQPIPPTALNKSYVQAPIYIGNYAFVPTAARTFFLGFQWDNQYGDLLAFNLTNLANPVLLGTLEQPQISGQYGGASPVLGATQADSAILYIGGTTSTSNLNNGSGRIQVVDISNPAAMKIAGQLLIPGTVHFHAPLIQGNVAVGIGNNGGYVGALNAVPVETGNIVVATFDVTDRRAPALITSVTTNYSVGAGGGATRIGTNLFAFAGVVDAANNPLLLVADISDPKKPVLNAYPIVQPFTSMQAVGSTLYATLGAGGFATFSIPGGPGLNLSCPASIDAVIVFDRGTALTSQSILSSKTAAKSFIDDLHLTPDQVGVVSFGPTATLAQALTKNAIQAKLSIDSINGSAASYIGAGIAAAQAELTGSRHLASATPLMVIVSDGRDGGAPNSSATQTAASAAKAAGIRVISLQLGAPTNSLMQSIASSNADYYLVPTP